MPVAAPEPSDTAAGRLPRPAPPAPPAAPPRLIHPPVEPWCVAGPDGLTLTVFTAGTRPRAVFVRSLPDNEELLTPLQPAASGAPGAALAWRGSVAWDGGHDLVRYAFVLVEADGRMRWFAADGEHALVPPEALHFRVHRHERPPAWVRRQVFYQVFPDRFAIGRAGGPVDRSGEPLHGGRIAAAVMRPWGAPPDREQPWNSFHGGDLPGLEQRLPYLNDELGVSAIYLNPVFAAASNHRYDTVDYGEVDPHLGGNAALASLRAAMRARGMRLVLDAVVNHTGADHPWFDHHGRHGPEVQRRERYAVDAQGRPVGWKGHDSLPVLDFANADVVDAVYGGDDSVLRRWLREPYAIDGWRLDVIHMLGEGPGARRNLAHVRAIRRAMREVNPEAFVLGEHFAEATRWLQGDAEDGAMNYFGFAQPVQAWLAGLPAPDGGGRSTRLETADFAAALVRAMAVVPYANQLAQLNLLDSHDTPRLFSVLEADEARMRLAFSLLFTWPGVPCVYYGDEIGLEGREDPDNRRCFEWDRDRWRTGLFDHVRQLARLRRTREEWAGGATAMLGHGEHWIAFARFTATAATLVLANRGPATTVEIDLGALPLAAPSWRPLAGRAPQVDGTRLGVALGAVEAAVLVAGG